MLHYLVTGNVPFARMSPVTIAQLAAEQLLRPDTTKVVRVRAHSHATHTQAQIPRINTHARARIHTHARTHAHTHTHTHTHTHNTHRWPQRMRRSQTYSNPVGQHPRKIAQVPVTWSMSVCVFVCLC